MAAMFLRYANFLRLFLFPFGQRLCIPKFKLIGPTVYELQFSNLIGATKWRIWAFFFIWPKNNVIHMCPEFGDDISFVQEL